MSLHPPVNLWGLFLNPLDLSVNIIFDPKTQVSSYIGKYKTLTKGQRLIFKTLGFSVEYSSLNSRKTEDLFSWGYSATTCAYYSIRFASKNFSLSLSSIGHLQKPYSPWQKPVMIILILSDNPSGSSGPFVNGSSPPCILGSIEQLSNSTSNKYGLLSFNSEI